MADDYVPYVPIPYTPLPYVSSREYSNRPYTQSLMELVGRAGQREAEATRRRSELLASRTGALGQIASSTLGSLFAGRDEAAKLAAAREQQRLENDYRERTMLAAADERRLAREYRDENDRNQAAIEAADNMRPNLAVSPEFYSAKLAGTPAASRFAYEPSREALLPARSTTEGMPMPGYAAPRPDATPDTSAQEFADPMGRTISPDIAARAELYRRMPNFAEQNAADVLESQRQARIAAQQNTDADNARADAAAKATAKYRNERLRQGQEGQVVQGPNGPVLVNRSKGTSIPVLNPDGSPMVTSSDLPPRVATRVDSKVKAFDASPVVKRIVTMAEGAQFVRSLDINTTNPADDQALVYAFAKAMDPDSVVREGEYATVQKYSQSWMSATGFNLARVLSNTEFLTPEARKNLRATIMQKFNSGRKQYDTLRNEYARQLNMVVGSDRGADYLTDYSAGFPAADGPRMVRDAQGNLRPEGE